MHDEMLDAKLKIAVLGRLVEELPAVLIERTPCSEAAEDIESTMRRIRRGARFVAADDQIAAPSSTLEAEIHERISVIVEGVEAVLPPGHSHAAHQPFWTIEFLMQDDSLPACPISTTASRWYGATSASSSSRCAGR